MSKYVCVYFFLVENVYMLEVSVCVCVAGMGVRVCCTIGTCKFLGQDRIRFLSFLTISFPPLLDKSIPEGLI